MSDPRETLARIRAQAGAASEGPWDVFMDRIDHPGKSVFAVAYDVGCDEDAEFIAAARTAVPALLDALEAVLKVHTPIDALMFSGRHQRMVAVCVGCGTDDGNWQRYPCPTVKAITDALEGETHD